MPSVYQEARTIITKLKFSGVIINKQMAPAKMAVVRLLTYYRSKHWHMSKKSEISEMDSDLNTLVNLFKDPIPKLVMTDDVVWELTDLLNYLTMSKKGPDDGDK